MPKFKPMPSEPTDPRQPLGQAQCNLTLLRNWIWILYGQMNKDVNWCSCVTVRWVADQMIFINVQLFIKLKPSETLLEDNYFLSTLNKLAIKYSQLLRSIWTSLFHKCSFFSSLLLGGGSDQWRKHRASRRKLKKGRASLKTGFKDWSRRWGGDVT